MSLPSSLDLQESSHEDKPDRQDSICGQRVGVVIIAFDELNTIARHCAS